MEINPDNNYHKIVLLNRLRIILVFLVRILLPILVVLIVLQFFILRYASVLKLNLEIFIYPLSLIVSAAVLSTPYLFYVLIKEKRCTWIILFFTIVGLPCFFVYVISFGKIFSSTWLIVIIAPFYFYFLLLKHTVGEWVAEYEGQEMRKERKNEEARRMKEGKWM